MVRFLYGARTSVVVGLGAVLLSFLLGIRSPSSRGTGAGVPSGHRPDLRPPVVLPGAVLGVLLSTALSLEGVDIGPFSVGSGSKLIPITVIGVVYVPYIARPLRGQVLGLREQQFVEAARASGMGAGGHEIRAHSPPLEHAAGALGDMLVNGAEVALSFLGAGVQPPEPCLERSRIADRLNKTGLPTLCCSRRAPPSDRSDAQRAAEAAGAHSTQGARARAGEGRMIAFVAPPGRRDRDRVRGIGDRVHLLALDPKVAIPPTGSAREQGDQRHPRTRATEKYVDDPLPLSSTSS